MKRVLSGTRPTSKLHLGNFLGALSNWIKLQEDHECFFMIADWHALTTEYEDPNLLKSNVLEVSKDYISAGLDPKKSVIFRQSDVKQHAELYLLLSMITPISWLERNPTYKEVMDQLTNKDLKTHGFLGYPVLQIADIVLYKANKVPVGQDQLPHLELGREIIRRFHSIYKANIFPEPDGILSIGAKVPGTDGRKMSKSYNNCIYLADSPAEVQKKLSTMVTDPARKKRTDSGDPDKCPVYDLHKIFNPDLLPIQQGCRSASIGCVDCKKVLAGHMQGILEPVYEKRQTLDKRPQDMLDILKIGAQKAQQVAENTLEEVRSAMGL